MMGSGTLDTVGVQKNRKKMEKNNNKNRTKKINGNHLTGFNFSRWVVDLFFMCMLRK